MGGVLASRVADEVEHDKWLVSLQWIASVNFAVRISDKNTDRYSLVALLARE